MPAEPTSYTQVSADYFAKRGLRRYAGVASLWALGVGAVISGHYSGWNLGLLAGGWGGLALAALVIAVMSPLDVCDRLQTRLIPGRGWARPRKGRIRSW